jgi:hypothetical protein
MVLQVGKDWEIGNQLKVQTRKYVSIAPKLMNAILAKSKNIQDVGRHRERKGYVSGEKGGQRGEGRGVVRVGTYHFLILSCENQKISSDFFQ